MILYIGFIFNILMIVHSNYLEIKSGIEDPKAYSVGLKFFTEITNNDIEDCTVEVFPEECCLDNNDNKCNIIEILGEANEVIEAGRTKAITMVAPLLNQFERKGYCTFYVDSSPISTPKFIKRDTVKIKFDTNLKTDSDSTRIKRCGLIDEDCLNDCKPVNCDIYYNGQKSYYSVKKKRCINIPTCLPNQLKPRSGYNPITNKCIDNNSINKIDIKIVRHLAQNYRTKSNKDLMFNKAIKKIKNNKNIETVNDQNYDYTVEEIDTNGVKITNNKDENNIESDDRIKYETDNISDADEDSKAIELTTPGNFVVVESHCLNFKRFLKYLTNNKYMTLIMTLVIIIQCIMISAMVFCMTKSCCCCKKQQTVQKIFNYHQDASVTTPLIGTSNIDTETTEYQYLSESSNYIDKKIKCYKACQKERKNNVKLSMSDDILSKCITRRDWNRLPKSETIPEINSEEIKETENGNEQNKQEIKVNFEEDNTNIRNKESVKESVFNIDGINDSEKEIRCHSYENNSNALNKSSIYEVYNQDRTKTDSIEKGAQACFSNDSIDDFLSERGMIFFGDNPSKYSFTSLSSAAKSTASNRSSKTSKNNIVKNVMSIFSKKSKGPASDPGRSLPKADVDLELLHISTASVFTSSNDTGTEKDLKRVKE